MPSFLTYELDRLFRSDRAPQGGDAEARAEAGTHPEAGSASTTRTERRS